MTPQPPQKFFSLLTLSICFAIAAFTPQPLPKHDYSSKTIEEKIADADLETIRQRVINDLLEPKVTAEEIEQLIKTQNSDGSWPGINYKDTTKTGFQHRVHLEHMLDLARALKKPGSLFYQNSAVKNAALKALDFWNAHDFICENWWWNEMGTPNWMINTLLVLDEDLSEKERVEGAKIASRASLTGVGARAGGDFVPITGMIAKQGLFKRNDSILSKALKVMADQIEVTRGRGIKPDLSFNHRVDNVTSIHTYGTNYVNAFTYWAIKTVGTKYHLSEDAIHLLADYYIDGIAKSMAYEKYTDPGARNRDLSRKGELHPEGAGTEIPEAFLLSTNYRKKEMQQIIDIRNGKIKPDLNWDKYFWSSSYFVHQRKNYFASVRMHSSRQNNMEEPYNEEGLKMHHIADGANFISRTGREYIDIFPSWNWQKIPGTTVVQRPEMPPAKEIAKKGKTDFVGGVSDGEFGAAAFDFSSPHDPLQARKAWFFFNNYYVCLGTAISSTTDYPVATTLNQCLLNGSVVANTNNTRQVLSRGNHNLQNVSWILHDSVGYLFPKPIAINVSNETATGAWRSINHQDWATDTPVSKDLFTAWYDHGVKPSDASYAYIVLPAVKEAALNQYAIKPSTEILRNTKEIQAVQNKSLGITQVVFYTSGNLKLSNVLTLTAQSPCMVMVKMKGNIVEEIAVSDPTQKLKQLQIKINTPIKASGENWKTHLDTKTKTSTITVDLPTEGYAGRSVVMMTGKSK